MISNSIKWPLKNHYINGSIISPFTLLVDAVIRDSKGATVWIKTGKNIFKSKMVETGAEADGRIEIKSGLQRGDPGGSYRGLFT